MRRWLKYFIFLGIHGVACNYMPLDFGGIITSRRLESDCWKFSFNTAKDYRIFAAVPKLQSKCREIEAWTIVIAFQSVGCDKDNGC